jgi:hypothetical protein
MMAGEGNDAIVRDQLVVTHVLPREQQPTASRAATWLCSACSPCVDLLRIKMSLFRSKC